MDITYWLQIAVVCFLGAVSPGPSLALVVGNTIARGRIYGIATSLGHAVGIGLWAFLTAIGIAEVIVDKSGISLVLQASGVCLLAYIGFRTITAKDRLKFQQADPQLIYSKTSLKGFSEGFLISLLNPKIAIFFLAIFSHLIHVDSSLVETLFIGIIAAVIDGLWYIFVTLMLLGAGLLKVFQERETVILRGSGLILIVVSLYLLGAMVQDLT